MEEKENNNNQNESPVTRWLRNAVLGATMADQPAMMIASGWRQNEKGDYVQDQQNDPHVKQLRDNLAAEGMGVMLGEFGLPAIRFGIPAIRGLGNKIFNNSTLRHQTVRDFAETIPESENLKAIMQSPNFTPASKVSNIKIGNKEGYYLGDIKFGNIGEQYGEEIIRRLQNLGHDTSQLMPMRIANNTIVGSPQGLIRKQVKEPIQVYSAKTSTTSVGSYDPTTGKAYLKVTNRPASKHASTAHHEGIMHRTDDIIDQATEGKVPAMYQELTNLMDNTGLLRTEGSNKWYELRATLGQAIRDAYIRGARQRNIKLSDFQFGTVRDAFNKSVDMLDAGELARVLRDINAYGEDYANVLGIYPQYLDKFKHLLKYAPSIIGVSNIIENE